MAVMGLGAAVGAVARVKLSGLFLHRWPEMLFPVGTFLANVAGCFLIGFLAALIERRDGFPYLMRLFLFPGILGGFTTFSAFGFETLSLMRRGHLLVAMLYLLGTVIAGMFAVWLGLTAGERLIPRVP